MVRCRFPSSIRRLVCLVWLDRRAHHSLCLLKTAGRSPQPMRREEPRLEEQPSANLRPAATTQGCRSWLVRATENIMLAPRCRQVAIERFRLRQRTAPPSPVCLEPALVHIQGILPARVLSLVKASTQETSSMTSQQGRVEKEASANWAFVKFTNSSDEPLTLYEHSVHGTSETPTRPRGKTRIKKYWRKGM